MANVTGQPVQGTGAQIQQPLHFQLRAGEHVLIVTRWDGGWANSVGVFLVLGILSVLGLFSGVGLWTFAGMILGLSTAIKFGLELISRLTGSAVLTDQRIVVKGLPSPFVSSQVELKDIQRLEAPTDLLRVGGGMSSLKAITLAGKTRGIVLPHASKIVEAYNARFHA